MTGAILPDFARVATGLISRGQKRDDFQVFTEKRRRMFARQGTE
jgi:hypothetical protein